MYKKYYTKFKKKLAIRQNCINILIVLVKKKNIKSIQIVLTALQSTRYNKLSSLGVLKCLDFLFFFIKKFVFVAFVVHILILSKLLCSWKIILVMICLFLNIFQRSLLAMPKNKVKESSDGFRRYCFRICDEHFERYQRLYKGTLAQFLIRCVVRASRSREFFDDVFFGVRSDD